MLRCPPLFHDRRQPRIRAADQCNEITTSSCAPLCLALLASRARVDTLRSLFLLRDSIAGSLLAVTAVEGLFCRPCPAGEGPVCPSAPAPRAAPVGFNVLRWLYSPDARVLFLSWALSAESSAAAPGPCEAAGAMGAGAAGAGDGADGEAVMAGAAGAAAKGPAGTGL